MAIYYNLENEVTEDQIAELIEFLREKEFRRSGNTGDFFRVSSQITFASDIIQFCLNNRNDLTVAEGQEILDRFRQHFNPISYSCDVSPSVYQERYDLSGLQLKTNLVRRC